ncbi:DUF6542 domain-containing protein [Nocardioides abyssi]|uniref:DUF6542 domain-containing protein n=1 Tax=Nocardioides abyssi TaxID=3058370 RepID=A0ABT8EPX5_9ACTN|nr:DUF6542 domain-containing protein [Nocardioides abyssi]MDN4160174.1 hypothetical protein [Nocardioides abyssi]
MERARTLWEEGREPAFQVVALGLAVTLTAVVLDVWLLGDVGLLFDLCFVGLCVALALRVRPSDFFVVGVLPPLLMLVVFAMLGSTRPDTIAQPHDGAVQAVVSGLSTHSAALVVGYLLCLACLFVRQRVLTAAGRPTDLLGS